MPEYKDIKREIAEWMSRIDAAKVVRKVEEDKWELNYKALFGEDWIGQENIRHRIRTGSEKKLKYPYPKLLAFLNTELPGLIISIPEVYITISDEAEAKHPGLQQVASIVQGRVNTILADLDGLDIDARIMLIDLFCAFMVAKVVRVNRITKVPETVAYIDEAGLPVGAPIEKSDPDYDILRVSPFNFLVDEKCQNNMKRALWVGEEIPKTLAALKNEGLYDEQIIAKLEDKIKVKTNNKDLKDWEIDLTIYEIYDKYEHNLYVFCEEYPEEYLRNETIPEGIEHNSYVVRKLNEIPGQFYPKTEVSLGRIIQDDYQDGRDWMRRRARKSNPQYGIAKSFSESSPTEFKKVGDGISDYVIVNKESDIFPLTKETQNQSPAITEHMLQCNKDFDEIMGQSSMSRGLVGESKFATEAEISQLKGDQRKQDKQMQIKIFWGMVIEKLLMLIATNKSEESEIIQALEVINPDLDVEINIEDRNPRTLAIERKQMIESLTAYPALQQSPTFVKNLLKTWDFRDQNKILQEVMAVIEAQTAQPQTQQRGLNLSLSLKHELLPPQAVDKIVDMIMNADIPIITGGNGGQQNQEIAPNESPMAGTEGMSPGSGMMPSGEVM